MTAPLFNLPMTSPIAGPSAANAGGQGALGGFEALLAAFFGTPTDQPGDGLFAAQAEGESVVDPDAKAPGDAPSADPVALAPGVPNDAMTLAAMLAAPQPAQFQTDPAQPARDGQPPASAPATPFAPQANAMPATAPVAGQPAPIDAKALADAQAGQPAADDTQVAVAPQAKPQLPGAPETTAPKTPTPSAPQVAAKPQTQPAQAQAAATVAPPQPTAPTADTALSELAQAEAAAAAQAEGETKPTEAQPAPRSTRHADATRRPGAAGAVDNAAPNQGAVLPNAVTAAASAEAKGQAASALETEAPVATTAEAKAEPAATDTPDFQPAAPAATAHAQAAPAHAGPARVTSETIANLTAQIGKKLEGRSTKFDVELTPAGLGHVSIAVEIAASGKMTAAMSFDSPQAAAELRARSHELQRALEQAGFDLAGGLSFDVTGDRGGDGRGLAQQQQQNDGAWRGRAFQAVLGTAGEAAEAAASAALQYARRSETGVDIRI